jgi:hypothetical protein
VIFVKQEQQWGRNQIEKKPPERNKKGKAKKKRAR